MSDFPHITEAEMHIMEVLWASQPLGAASITQKLQETTGWHRKTVNTMLSRLVKKKAVSFVPGKSGHQYSSIILRDDYTQTITGKLVNRFFGGRLAPLVAHFVDTGSLSRDDIDELKSLIEGLSDERD